MVHEALQVECSTHRVRSGDEKRSPDAMGKSKGSTAHRWMRTVSGW